MPSQRVTLHRVSSSNLFKIGYDAEAKELHVVFISNKQSRYVYKNVPAAVFKGLESADSHGSYFAAHIKNDFSFTKIPNK